MKMIKTISLMAMGAGAYMMYDKYGKKIVNKMSKKMDCSLVNSIIYYM